jgi:hypothetical protein
VWVPGSRRHAADARLQEGELIAETGVANEASRLGKLIETRLPEIDLPDLLIEVDGWTNFTDQLVPLSGNRSRSADIPCVLYAAIIAQATNLALTGMARASEFSYQQLESAWEQCCREQTLTAASACLVDYHHQLPLTHAWGPAGCRPPTGSDSRAVPAARESRRCRATSATAAAGFRSTRGPQTGTASTPATSSQRPSATRRTRWTGSSTTRPCCRSRSTPPMRTATSEMIFGSYDLLGLRFAADP